MSLTSLLTIYCSLVALAALVGGAVPMLVRITHRGMQLAISGVAGVILGVGLLHLLPHSVHLGQSVDLTATWMLGGFLLMFFLERLFHFHHHDVPDDPTAPACGLDHSPHAHDENADHEHAAHEHHQHRHGEKLHKGVEVQHSAWWGAAVGLAVHSLIDGIAIAAGVAAELEGSHVPAWAGLGTFLAVALHKPFDSLTIGTLMAAAGCSRRTQTVVNLIYAAMPAVGVALFAAWARSWPGEFAAIEARALGFAAGSFLCIATSDLLPELQFHSHDRGKLSLALVCGVLLAWSIILFEPAGHDHHQRRPDAHGHEHAHEHDAGHGEHEHHADEHRQRPGAVQP